MEVTWRKVGAIRRMLEDFPLEISQRLICLVGSMGMRLHDPRRLSITFLEDGVTLNSFLAGNEGCFHCTDACFARAGNGEPKTHHLWQFGLAYCVLHHGSDGKGSHHLVLTAAQRILYCWFSGAYETMRQVPQCTGRLCWKIKVFFKSVFLFV
jgi:hypothetical protein